MEKAKQVTWRLLAAGVCLLTVSSVAPILENYPKVQSVTVELKKPEAPINAVFDYVSVEMTRSRA